MLQIIGFLKITWEDLFFITLKQSPMYPRLAQYLLQYVEVLTQLFPPPRLWG